MAVGIGNEERLHRFKELKVTLDSFVEANAIGWICIFDQENGLYKSSMPLVYPFNLVESFFKQVCLWRAACVACASAVRAGCHPHAAIRARRW